MSPRSIIRARTRRPSRRSARPRRRARQRRARCSQPHRRSRARRARRRPPPRAARAPLAPASRPFCDRLHLALVPVPHHSRPSPQPASTRRAVPPPRASIPSALFAATPTLSRPPSTTPAVTARRASAPRSLLPLSNERLPLDLEPAQHLPCASPQTEKRRAARPRRRARRRRARRPQPNRRSRARRARRRLSPHAVRAPRAPVGHPQRPAPHCTRARSPVQYHPRPRPPTESTKSRGLAAAQFDAERAVLSRADALVPFERGVGLRRTPREHSAHALRARKSPPRRLPFFLCPVTPFAPRTHMRTDESRPRRRSRRRRARGLAPAPICPPSASPASASAARPASAPCARNPPLWRLSSPSCP